MIEVRDIERTRTPKGNHRVKGFFYLDGKPTGKKLEIESMFYLTDEQFMMEAEQYYKKL